MAAGELQLLGSGRRTLTRAAQIWVRCPEVSERHVTRGGGILSRATYIAAPAGCTGERRMEFARFVRRGFPAAEDLERRVAEAAMLGFHYRADHTLIAIAALKAPSEKHRERLFEEAHASVSAVGYALDLGWVLVDAEHRANGIASRLCGALLDRVPASHVFATTRPSNEAMITVLRRLGFSRVGVPFPHPQRGEELVLFTRPGPSGAPNGEPGRP